jgi:LCP family protein required for cell wall assembly
MNDSSDILVDDKKADSDITETCTTDLPKSPSFFKVFSRILIVFILIASLAFSAAFVKISLALSVKDFSYLAKPFLPNLKEHYVILLAGTDKKIGVNRTDSMILIFIDTKHYTIDAISILRDIYIPWLKKKNKKLNAVYAYDIFKNKDEHHAMVEVQKAIERLLNVKIDYYIKVDLQGFIRVIDLIGGVDIYVDKNMKYDDNKQNLHIRLKKGYQHLDGEKAQQFVRFRRDRGGDKTRAKRQQRFIRAIMKRLTTPTVVLRIPDILRGIFREITTNFQVDVALSLATRFLNSGKIKVSTSVIPGRYKRIDNLDYYKPDMEKTKKIIDSFYNPKRFSKEIITTTEQKTKEIGLTKENGKVQIQDKK